MSKVIRVRLEVTETARYARTLSMTEEAYRDYEEKMDRGDPTDLEKMIDTQDDLDAVLSSEVTYFHRIKEAA
jgi:hypothetical protein